MTLALARKYRPKSFENLIGQESVSQTLSQALNQDRLSHAYLFSGLRGSGKTSTARIFAKALLCEKGVSAKPCETCQNCIAANEGRHLDIVEMDAASNRKIDDIRELIEHTKYKPSTARFKVFIIDEVHMLTKEAFNAILKTLEEPPDFVKFILATTDPLKIPATILSRSQHFRFKKIPQPLVLTHLEHILNEEGIEYQKDALQIIARSGAGSLRDSLTLLDQAIVYAQGGITKEIVTKMLGIIDPKYIQILIENILHKDIQAIVAFIEQFSEYESAMILDEMTIYLKDKLLSQDKLLSPMIIERFFRIIAQSKELLHMGSDEEFVLSLTLFKMIEAVSIKDIDSMIEELETSMQSGQKFKIKQSSANEPVKEKDEIKPNDKTVHEEEALKQIKEEKSEFDSLVALIYDKDYELGKCFEENIEFIGYEEGVLRWSSSAQGDCKEQLKNFYSHIKTFVEEIFGEVTKIELVSKEQNSQNSNGSSCMEQNSGLRDTPSSKELDPKQIVNEPMVKKAAQLFKPEKIKLQPKV